MNILITGGAGFIGFHLAKRLMSSTQHNVVMVDNINSYYDTQLKFDRLLQLGIDVSADSKTNSYQEPREIKSTISDKVVFYHSDICHYDNLTKIAEKHNIEFVFNLAAQAGVRYAQKNPQQYIQSNILGFFNIMELCKTYNLRLMYASSSSVYGLNGKMPFSESDATLHPVSLYAATKISNEVIAHSYASTAGVSSIGLRFFTVYGEYGRPDMALYSFTKNIIEGKPIQLFNNGNVSRDFTYISDIINIIEQIFVNFEKAFEDNPIIKDGQNLTPARSIYNHRVLNIGRNELRTLNEFVTEIENAVGKKAIKEYLDMQTGDVKATYADMTQIKSLFNIEPKISLHEGVANFVAWYREYHSVTVYK